MKDAKNIDTVMFVPMPLPDFFETIRMIVKDEINKQLPESEDKRGYKSKEVRKILGCCAGTLRSLRIGGTLRTKKVGGTVYYLKTDVDKIFKEGW